MTLLAPLFAQNSTFPASTFRRLVDAALTTGVCGPADLKVVPRALGANMSVDVGPGDVVVPGPSGSYVCGSTAVENFGIAAAPGTGSRIDLVLATVRDSQATGSGSDSDWYLHVVTGTPGGTPAVPATPNYSTVLARVTVPAGTGSITTARITDYRTAATAPADLWTSLPGQGRNGQVIGTTDGKAWVWQAGGWQELAQVASSILYDTAEPADHTPNTSFDTWGTVTFPAQGHKVLVEATLTGFLSSTTGSIAVGQFVTQISTDNGVSSPGSPLKSAASPDAFSPTPFADHWQRTSDGSGIIVVRARIASSTGSASFQAGQLTATVTPVA